MRRNWKTAALSAAIAGAGIFAFALVSGILYEQSQRVRDRERFPQIGRSIDIGGRKLNIDCAGAGQPAVILESGANWAARDPKTMFANGGPRPGYSWVSIQRALAAATTVCWYDRAGSGWSDPGPYPRDSASQARDLHALLQAAKVLPPYVLVGESSAALDARVYTGFYPFEVSGLVLVNSTDPALFLNRPSGNGNRAARIPQAVYHSQDAAAQLFNFVGLYRLGPVRPAPSPPKGLTAAEWNTIWFLTHSPKAISALMQDIASWRLSSVQAQAQAVWAIVPCWCLAVRILPRLRKSSKPGRTHRAISHGDPQEDDRLAIGKGASDLLYDAPDAIIEAVRQVIAEVRELNKLNVGAPVNLPESTREHPRTGCADALALPSNMSCPCFLYVALRNE